MIERYTLPEMGQVWSDQAKYQTWLEVEIEAARAMAHYGIIPQKAFAVISKKARFNVARINKIEKEVNHDVIAFLTSVSESIGENAKYVHFGLTSSDVVDTGLSLQLKRAAEIISDKIDKAIAETKRLALKYKMTLCIGRTHGIIAEPTTVGLKFAMWYTELVRRRNAFDASVEGMRLGCISGAVGTFAHLDPKIEAFVCKRLGLKPARVTTQIIQRDVHAEFISAIALLGSSLEQFAVEIRNLQRTEIGEMSEGFSKSQKGSSAMPHKRNPITAERISGLARLLRGYSVAAMENIPLWHERDISHSSVERVIFPDATIVIDYALQKFIDVLINLVVNETRMMENIFFNGGVVFSQRILLGLAAPVGSREKAYRMVQRTAFQAAEGKGKFRDLLKADKEIAGYLSVKEIDACFDLKYYTKNVPVIFREVFGR